MSGAQPTVDDGDMAVLANDRDLTFDELRHTIVSDLERFLPEVDAADLAREVTVELSHFGDARVQQYLPVLVARQVRQHHR